jgi:hypothetical protein
LHWPLPSAHRPLVTVLSIDLVDARIAASLADTDVPTVTTSSNGSPTAGEKIKGWATDAWNSWPYQRAYLYATLGGLVAVVAAGVTYKRCSKKKTSIPSASAETRQEDAPHPRPNTAGSRQHSVGPHERSLKEWRQLEDKKRKSRTGSQVDTAAVEADTKIEAAVAEAEQALTTIQVYPASPRSPLLPAPPQPLIQQPAWQSGGLTRSVSGSSTPRHPGSQCVIDVVEASIDDVQALSVSNEQDQQHSLSLARSVRHIHKPSTPSALSRSSSTRRFVTSQPINDGSASDFDSTVASTHSSHADLQYTRVTIPRTPTSASRSRQ